MTREREYEDAYPTTAQAGAADLSGVTVSDCSWLPNPSRGFEELVRKRDGQVLDRRPLKPARRQAFTPASAGPGTEDGAFEPGDNRDQTSATDGADAETPRIDGRSNQMPEERRLNQGSHRQSSLEVLGPGSDGSHVEVRCKCGWRGEKRKSAVEGGLVRSCGHHCPLKPPRKSPGRQKTVGPAPRRQVAQGKRRAGGRRNEPALAEPLAVPVMSPPREVDYAAIGGGLESIEKLILMIPERDMLALVERLGQMESALPEGDFGRKFSDYRADVVRGRQKAEIFLDFRRRLEAEG